MRYIKEATILVIDDEMDNLMIIEDFLSDTCQQVISQTDPKLGLKLAQEQQPDIILLDIIMREMDGYETCQHLKENIQTQAIPVIFLSSMTRVKDKVKGFNLGAVDYISKPFSIEEMIVRIESCLKLHYQLQKNSPHLKNIKEKLTLRERQTLNLYLEGYSRKEMALSLQVSDNTIKSYINNIFQKNNIKNRAELLKKIKSS